MSELIQVLQLGFIGWMLGMILDRLTDIRELLKNKTK